MVSLSEAGIHRGCFILFHEPPRILALWHSHLWINGSYGNNLRQWPPMAVDLVSLHAASAASFKKTADAATARQGQLQFVQNDGTGWHSSIQVPHGFFTRPWQNTSRYWLFKNKHPTKRNTK